MGATGVVDAGRPETGPRPLPRDAAGLLSGTLLLGLGERLGERFTPLFLVDLGGGTLAVGLYQAASNLVGAMAALPGGFLADRIGSKRALQWFAASATAGFVLLAISRSWWLAVIGALAGLSWSAVSLPAALVLVTRAIPVRNSAWGVSVHSFVRRVPMALGPLIAGLLVAVFGEGPGLRRAFALAAALGVVTLVAQQILIRPTAATVPGTGPERVPFDPWHALRAMSPPLRTLFVADTLIRFCEQIPYAFVVLWCLRVMPHPIDALRFGGLTALEMTVAMLAYAPGAWLSDRIGKPATVAVTFVFFALFPLVLLTSHSMATLALAFLLRGLKEIGEPTRKSLILDLCPVDSRATHFGWYYCVRDSFAALAAGLGAVLWQVSPATCLTTASAFGFAGLIGYTLSAVRSRRGS
ncbi:MAG: MFS transporter [Candidatus Eisenbacteria bacterium]